MSSAEEMSRGEIEQFLTCARIGRLGMCMEDGPYVVPVGYVYAEGKIFFHTCNTGLKIRGIERNPNICFEVDEALSDTSMFKSVIVFGTVAIINDKEKMIPHLQKLIDKYRIPVGFEEYMKRPGRDRERELKAVRICVITPRKMTGRKFVRENGNF